MADFHDRASFLRSTGTFEGFLDVNSLPHIPKAQSDTTYIVESRFDGRPDLLAHALYKNTRLWWVFAMRNPDVIKDPLRDFKEGVKIKLPSKGTIESIIG